MARLQRRLGLALAVALVAMALPGRAQQGTKDGEWHAYSGDTGSTRYAPHDQITRDNVKNLTLKWVWRPRYLDKMESTPLVVDGVLYAVQNSEVVALDAETGRNFWTFRYQVPPESNAYTAKSRRAPTR